MIQDNREWDWSVFECQLRFAPNHVLEPGKPYSFEVRFRGMYDPAAAQAVVDEFGQYKSLNWPGKVRSEAELRRDAARERVALDRELRTEDEAGRWDRFGGLADSGRRLGLEATGRFRVARIDGRDWLVTPEGNIFFSVGVCALTTWDTFTPVTGREAAFGWLPDAASDAWIHHDGGRGVSLYITNLRRKFGDAHRDAFRTLAHDRFRAWGFNTVGAFGDRLDGMPYVHWRLREAILAAGTPIPETSYSGSGSGIIDIYAEGIEARLDKTIAGMVRPVRNDPWMIGYFLGNEEFWHSLPATISALPGAWASKRRLVAELKEHYGSVEAMRRDFRTEATDWAAAEREPLWAHTDVGRERLTLFGVTFADRYFRLITEAVRRHDPDHLILGMRLLPTTADGDVRLLAALGRHCDVVSINYYTDAFEVDRVARWREAFGKPLLLSEWSYGAAGRGHTGGPRTVADQPARAAAYAAYISAAGESGGVVGCHWFEYLDQPVTGRMNERDQGERYNVGLVDVTDRPYDALVNTAARANREVYDAARMLSTQESR